MEMNLSSLQEALSARLGDGLPKLIAVVLILLIGYFVAKLLQRVTYKLLQKTGLDNRLAAQSGSSVKPERALSKIVYYVVMVIVLTMAMETLGLTRILDPLNNMVTSFLGFVPNLVAAALIGFIGYVIAKIVSSLVGMGADFLRGIGEKAGLGTEIDLVSIARNVVFIIIFVPIAIAALDALQLDAITEPAKEMLSMFIEAIPRIIAAVLIIGLFYLGGKFITGLLGQLLESLGADKMAERLQLQAVIGQGTSLSGLISNAAFFFLMFLGIITGVERLGFDRLNLMLTDIFALTGQIAFGLVVLALGNYLANLAYSTMSAGRSDTFIASLARIVILGLFLAIALDTMGIADDIVNLAFGLTLGAVAVAVALSFGLGGREAAGEQMKRILDRFNKDGKA